MAGLACGSSLVGCSAGYPAQHLPAAVTEAIPPTPFFTMRDGVRLPYRQWLPAGGAPGIVVLALHGFNDSRDAWEIPAPVMAAAGIAVIAPDQRGFGEAPDRGRWAGSEQMAEDAGAMARALRRRFPAARLFLMGESMGGAVLMQLASQPDAPDVAGYVLVAPAVWGRSEMGLFLRGSLWITNAVAPGLSLSAGPFRVKASDNRAALVRLSTDPLTLQRTRVAALKGLTDLMDDALAACSRITAPALFLYGGRDELVPKAAMAAAWRRVLQTGGRDEGGTVRFAYYPDGYHLLLRDTERAERLQDVIAWLQAPGAALPSGADTTARAWLADRRPRRALPLSSKAG